ncbi:MAG: restriction endonuclease subunit S [Methanobrevibacter sp.]|nr:restriction endonuclease subunit S [Methanobrevibacter sp.]MBR6516101.1 restriction endonuclease subunit S [Bacilli bacterium]
MYQLNFILVSYYNIDIIWTNLSLEFSTIALNDIVSLVIDYRGKTPKKLGADWSESGIRALSAKNIKTGQIIREDAIRYVDIELYNKWMKDEIKRNDILITSEAPFGEVFFWDSDEKIVLSQRLFGVRCDENKVDPKFIYFYMTSEMFQWELQSRATGTTVKGLRQPELLKCQIQLPNIDNQRRISYILSNIESKINVLKELNKKLLQYIYKKIYLWKVKLIRDQEICNINYQF